MPEARVYSLEAIRTDGWFERIGEGIGSFQALCDIIGPRFFAFAMITGARIVALTVDRRNPDNTLVDYALGPADAEPDSSETQRLTLLDFRRRLTSALVQEEPIGPPPERPTDMEALQLHIGVRYLLLAPLYGYSLKRLSLDSSGATIELLHDGVEEAYSLPAFRNRLRTHVREELERASRGRARSAIDLSRVADAEKASRLGDHLRVLELLGAWPAPLAIFLRTPEGQMLSQDTRATIARALGILGGACIALNENEKGEEVLRLGIQYAGDGVAAPELFTRLGESMLAERRYGEAIGPLRRAVNLGADGERIWPLLANAFAERGRGLAAWASILEAEEAGLSADSVKEMKDALRKRLGPSLSAWEELAGGQSKS